MNLPFASYEKAGLTNDVFFLIHNGFTQYVEGGYSNDKNDSGGETLFGLSRVNNPDWKCWPKIDKIAAVLGRGSKRFKREVENNEEFYLSACRIFMGKYFMPLQCDKFSLPTAACMYDLGIHGGPKRSIKIAQKSCCKMGIKLDDDGVLGPLTLGAMLQLDSNDLAKWMLRKRLAWHRKVSPHYINAFTDRVCNLWSFCFQNEPEDLG